jgi:hypothetical protein
MGITDRDTNSSEPYPRRHNALSALDYRVTPHLNKRSFSKASIRVSIFARADPTLSLTLVRRMYTADCLSCRIASLIQTLCRDANCSRAGDAGQSTRFICSRSRRTSRSRGAWIVGNSQMARLPQIQFDAEKPLMSRRARRIKPLLRATGSQNWMWRRRNGWPQTLTPHLLALAFMPRRKPLQQLDH